MAKNERGSGIVLLVSIVATLAILAASLVWITGNMQQNSANDRTRVKAFGVTEAALDSGMAALSAQWPGAAGNGPDLSTTAEAAFRSEFSSSEYPAPTSPDVEFVSWQYFDNQDPIDPAITWDKGSPEYPDVPDNRVWLVAQANVGSKSARIQTLVERTYLDTGVPRGVALYAGGNLLSNGHGNNPKIVIEVPPPDIQTTVRAGGYIDDLTVSASNIVDLEGSAAGTVDDVFPSSLRDSLKAIAIDNDRYFTSVDAAQNSPADANWSPEGGLSGLCVVETTQTVSLRAGEWNSEAEPGFLLVLGGGNIDFAGSGDYWGVMYTDGTVDKGHGTFTVHGMVVAASTVDMRGTVNVNYNDNVIAKLQNRWSLNVRVVPNTWRELQPTE